MNQSASLVTEPSADRNTSFTKKKTLSSSNLSTGTSPQKISSKLFFQIPEIRPKRASQPDQQNEFSIAMKPSEGPMSFEVYKERSKTPKPYVRPTSVTPAARIRMERVQRGEKSKSPDFARSTTPISTQRPCTTNNSRREGHEKNNSFVVPSVSLYVEKKARERSSELRVQIKQENKKVQQQGKVAGGDVLNTTNQRREVERQVQCMENRIKRLQFEEMQTQKKINQVMEKTQKVLANKARHEEDLANKQMRIQKKELYEQQRREEIQNQKEEAKLNNKKQKLNRWKNRFEDAYALKKTNDDYAKQAQTKKKEEEEKKKEAARRVREWERMSQKMRNMKKECDAKTNAEKYDVKAQLEKQKAQELEEKIKRLEEIEKELVARAGVTRSLHNAKLAELENSRIMNIKDEKLGNEL